MFSNIGKLALTIVSVSSVKLIKDKITGKNQGYAFVEFATHEIAKTIFENLNGSSVPHSDR